MDPLDLIFRQRQIAEDELAHRAHDPNLDVISAIFQQAPEVAQKAAAIYQDEKSKDKDTMLKSLLSEVGPAGLGPSAPPPSPVADGLDKGMAAKPSLMDSISGKTNTPDSPTGPSLIAPPKTPLETLTPPKTPNPLQTTGSTSTPESPEALARRLLASNPSTKDLSSRERTQAYIALVGQIRSSRASAAALAASQEKDKADLDKTKAETGKIGAETTKVGADTIEALARADKAQQEKVSAANKETIDQINRFIDPSKLQPKDLQSEVARIAQATGTDPSLVASTWAQKAKEVATADAKSDMDLKSKQAQINQEWSKITETSRHNKAEEGIDLIKANKPAAHQTKQLSPQERAKLSDADAQLKQFARLGNVQDQFRSGDPHTIVEPLINGINDKLRGIRNDSDRAAYTQQIETAFNAYRKAITGAAASEKEIEMLRKAIVNASDDPQTFKKILRNMINAANDSYDSILETAQGAGVDTGTLKIKTQPPEDTATPKAAPSAAADPMSDF